MSLLNNNYDAIKLNNVSYKHSNVTVLEHISLSIPKGQWIALAGRNGSGKSTFARLINGLLQANDGDIFIHGTKLQHSNIYDIRAQIGYIFASPDNQFIGLTVRDDIAFGLENLCLPRDVMEARIEQYAQMFDLVQLLDRHPATLSGGQKQRAALAAVLAMQPSILILDEATSMLDSSFRDQFLSYITKLNKEQRITVITISHDIKELTAADRLIMLSDGNIIADDEPASLLKEQQLLKACRLEIPYPLQLCYELKKLGVDIAETIDEQEVLEKLWALHSNKSLINIKKRE